MTTPNFFIAGAPKCGTTALSVYLGEHPEIFITVPKEPFFYATDLPGLRKVETTAEYLELYPQQDRCPPCAGEASTLYLFSLDAIPNIVRSRPDAKIIVMLRNPIDLVRSYHSQLLYGLIEDENDIARAWNLQARRSRGERIPPLCPEPKILQYGDVARLGSQMDRLLRVVPPQQVCTIMFDDFVANPARTYQQVLDFLGVPDDGRNLFQRVNPNKVYRYRSLATIKTYLFKRHLWFERLARRSLAATGMEKFAHRLMSKNVAHNPLTSELRSTLVTHFEPEVARLSEILKRDLSRWTAEVDER